MEATSPAARRPRGPAALLLLGPFSRTAWRDAAFVAAGSAVLAPSVAAEFGGVPGPVNGGVFTLTMLLVLAAIAFLPFTLVLVGRLQRGRYRALLGLELEGEPLFAGRPGWRALANPLSSRAAWRAAAYHLFWWPLAAVAGIGVVVLWLAAFGSVILGLFVKAMPDGSPLRNTDLGKGIAPLLFFCGLVALWLAPALTRGLAALETRAAQRLLGPDRERRLEERVVGLTESRSALVAAVDAERRRIERDLHDGTQQRLVSLAINLGLARTMLTGLTPETEAVLVDAHEQAKAALTELRDLVRGLHPAVLDDRGLDAALSGIADRTPLPVRLTVDLPGRAAPAVEAVAYFVVSEALTNVAKHARANVAAVDVAYDRPRGRLRIRITDDGLGGADPRLGTGLAGLARRAGSVDGSFQLSSPPGGPTVVTVELPCVL